MKYISTLDIWSPQIQEAIVSGQIKLQRGQWLRCGSTGKRCRFVGITGGGTVHVIHWQGSSSETNRVFMSHIEFLRLTELHKAFRKESREGKTTATWQEYQATSH